MTDDEDAYFPPRVWTHKQDDGGLFGALNRPVAGATHPRELPVGRHPFQLYSLATPNGQKVTILFEELLAAGHAGAEYDAWPIHILKAEQFGSGFTAANPNSKIPALVDRSGAEPVRVFESGAILLHLADRFGAFLPLGAGRAECLSWLFWQVGSAPLMSGMFGHFYHYAPGKLAYAIDRYAMETKRLFDVADRRLGESRFLAGEDYTIADIALFPWLRDLQRGVFYGEAAGFLALESYANVARWVAEIDKRPAVRRGRMVNGVEGSPPPFLSERHDAADFAGLVEP
ncbi:MAG: glutathione-dependent disulfide-bond oxidoreductase [Novosphingobium sp.]